MNIKNAKGLTAGRLIVFILAFASLLTNAELRARGDEVPENQLRFGQRALIIFADVDLGASLSADEPTFRKRGVFTQMQVQIGNRTQNDLPLEYQVVWMDEEGFEVGTRPAWNTLFLSPSEVEGVQATGQHKSAYSVKIILRKPRQ